MKMAEAEFLLFFLTSLVCRSNQGAVIQPNFNSETDGVVELKQTNFKTLVLNTDDSWIVEFSAPDCIYCIQASEFIKKAVPLLKEKKIKVGHVDFFTTEGQALADTYGVDMFPICYIFGRDKEHPVKYQFSPMSAEQFANTVEYLMKKPPAAKGPCGQITVQDEESDTYELTDENFEEVVLKCQDPWIVNFYVPEVTVCNQFLPYFEAAAKEFKGRAKFGSFYQVGSKVAKKYDVTMACTVKLFPLGNKNRPPVDYNNGSHSIAISTNLISWTRTALSASLPVLEIAELTSQNVLESKCNKSDVSSCIILFLAKSDQCNADCQRNTMNLLTRMDIDMNAESYASLWRMQEKQPGVKRKNGLPSFPTNLIIGLLSTGFGLLHGAKSGAMLKEFIHAGLNSKNTPPS